MLVSEKIKSLIKKEIKAQESVINILENQEKEYGLDFQKEKKLIKESIDYYNKILKEE